MGAVPKMLCKDNEEGEFEECDMETACSGKISKADINKSLVSWLVTFTLYCDSESTFWFYESLFFVGVIMGFLLLSPFVDHFGRKSMILVSSIAISLAYLKLIFTKGAGGWAIVLLFSGASAGLYYTTALSYLSEVILQETAIFYISGIHLAFPLSGVTSSFLIRHSPNWKTPATLMSVIPLLIIAYFAYVVESPRYLAARRSYKDARTSINLICNKNSVPPKRWMFEPESIVYNKSFIELDTQRQSSYYQTSYILSNRSGLLYFIAFGEMLLFICFSACEPLLEVQEFSDMFTTYIVEYAVMFVIIFLTGFFFSYFGYKFPLFVLLIAMIIISGLRLFQFSGFSSAFLLWTNKLCALWAVIGAVSFSSLSCPIRVRSSGLGLVLSLGLLGFLLGAVILRFLPKLNWLLCIAPKLALIGLKFTSEPWNYKTNDDIYELVEEATRNFSHYIKGTERDSTKHNKEYYMDDKQEDSAKSETKKVFDKKEEPI